MLKEFLQNFIQALMRRFHGFIFPFFSGNWPSHETVYDDASEIRYIKLLEPVFD